MFVYNWFFPPAPRPYEASDSPAAIKRQYERNCAEIEASINYRAEFSDSNLCSLAKQKNKDAYVITDYSTSHDTSRLGKLYLIKQTRWEDVDTYGHIIVPVIRYGFCILVSKTDGSFHFYDKSYVDENNFSHPHQRIRIGNYLDRESILPEAPLRVTLRR